MADHTFASGEVLTAANVNSYLNHTGGAWNSWTPAVTQSVSVTVTVSNATYHRVGRLITAYCQLSVTGAGSAANDIVVTLPITSAGYSTTTPIGLGHISDSSAGLHYYGFAEIASSTTIKFRAIGNSTGVYLGNGGFSAALASSDVIGMSVTYEASAG